MLTFEIKGMSEAIGKLNRLNTTASQKVKKAVTRSSLNIEKKAKRKAPVDTGRLRGSIRTLIYGDGLAASVGSDLAYASHVEWGTSPHSSSEGKELFERSIRNWARRQGNEDNWFAIRQAIRDRGTPPKPFLYPAYDSERDGFITEVKEALKDTE